MTAPTSKGRAAWTAIATVVAGFVGFGILGFVHEGVAMLAAVGAIGFAAISLVVALVRKH